MAYLLAAICMLLLLLTDTCRIKPVWHEDQPLTHINDDYIRAFQKQK